jgi:glycosyltransferase involved in cell wall biosynthesis
LIKDKKIDLLIKGFKISNLSSKGVKLLIIGSGPELEMLLHLRNSLLLQESVNFVGEVFDQTELSIFYSSAIASVCPGYVGLSLTQSAGFGVPMILSSDDPHSPEFDLTRNIKHYIFKSNDPENLAEVLRTAYLESKTSQFENSCENMVKFMRHFYNYELMAEGLFNAILNRQARVVG